MGIVKGEGMDNSVETVKGEGTVNYLKEKEKKRRRGTVTRAKWARGIQ